MPTRYARWIVEWRYSCSIEAEPCDHRVILERFRRAEQSQHAIPQSLGDDAIMLMDGGAHQRQDRSDASQRRLGILALDMRGQVFQVRKKHAYVFAFPAAGAQRVELLPERRFLADCCAKAAPQREQNGWSVCRAGRIPRIRSEGARALVASCARSPRVAQAKPHRSLCAHALPVGAVNLPAAGPGTTLERTSLTSCRH